MMRVRRLALLSGLVLVVAACGSAADSGSETTSASGDGGATTTVSSSDGGSGSSTTTAAETTTTEAEQDGPSGSLDDPIPAGTWVRVGDWQVAVTQVIRDATEAVLAENSFNEEPAAGNQFVMWRIAASNLSEEPGEASFGLSFSVVGPSAVAYDYEADCGVTPDGFDGFRTVYPGGTVEGNECWSVASSDVDGLVLLVDESFSFNPTRLVFSIPPDEQVYSVEYPTPPVPDPDGPVGSRGNPNPTGEAVTIGDYTVTVTGFNPDATDAVLAENSFNEEPAEGSRFVTVSLEVTYTGTESSTPAIDLSFGAVGQSAVGYSSEQSCGVIPSELDTFSEMFPGGTIAGDLCWEVTDEDVDSLVFVAYESFSFDTERVFFGLGQ